ncbi:MAG TPA: glycosyltransferase [Actinomycetales bacterium]|nr:glycosyltransferase [Actinomycetales bacterium]
MTSTPERGQLGTGLRVLLLLGTSTGGVGRHVLALARCLAVAGHHVTVAGPQETEDDFGFTSVGATFVPVETRDRPHPREDARAVKAVRELALRADVVHAHGLRAGGVAVLALRRSDVPLAVTLHNALLAKGIRGGPVVAAYAVLERLVARGAQVVLGVSSDLEDRLRQLGATDVRHAVIPAPDAGPVRRGAQEVRAELEAPDQRLVVCVARLAEQKGLPLLLDAAAVLRERRDDVLVVVAGDGPLRDRLQGRIDDERLPVRLLGWRDDVPDLMAAADVVVSSAVWEGQPLAVQQALHAGAALVATDVGGTRAATADAAVLVPYGDAERLAGEVGRLLDDDAARSSLRAAARRRAADLPDADDACRAAEELYRDLVSG